MVMTTNCQWWHWRILWLILKVVYFSFKMYQSTTDQILIKFNIKQLFESIGQSIIMRIHHIYHWKGGDLHFHSPCKIFHFLLWLNQGKNWKSRKKNRRGDFSIFFHFLLNLLHWVGSNYDQFFLSKFYASYSIFFLESPLFFTPPPPSSSSSNRLTQKTAAASETASWSRLSLQVIWIFHIKGIGWLRLDVFAAKEEEEKANQTGSSKPQSVSNFFIDILHHS